MLEKTLRRIENLENNLSTNKSQAEIEAGIANLFKTASPDKMAEILKSAGYSPRMIQYAFFIATKTGVIEPKDNKSEYWEELYD